MVSVNTAIQKGQWWVTYPCAVIFLGGNISAFFLAKLQDWFPVWLTTIFIIALSFSFAWFWWSFYIVKWKIWAFNNVRNVHELKEKAIRENLIYNDKNFFNKSEIYSKTDELKWNEIQQKFLVADEIIDTKTLADSTNLELSFFKMMDTFIAAIALLIVGIVWFIKSKEIAAELFSYPIIGLGLYIFYNGFKKYRNNKLQLIISNNGIEVLNEKKYSWDDIYGEKIIREGFGKNSDYYIQFSTPDKAYKIKANQMDCSIEDIETMLKTYRFRFIQQQE